jgi:hypothetical protein
VVINGPVLICDIREPLASGDYLYVLPCLNYTKLSLQFQYTVGVQETLSFTVLASLTDDESPKITVAKEILHEAGAQKILDSALYNYDINYSRVAVVLTKIGDGSPNNISIWTLMRSSITEFPESGGIYGGVALTNANFTPRVDPIWEQPVVEQPEDDALIDSVRFQRLRR